MNMKDTTDSALQEMTRRHFFRQGGFGIGALALSALLDEKLFAQGLGHPVSTQAKPEKKGAPANAPHFAPKAKNIIYLFMAGAPSQLDLLDYKPKLQQFDGQPCPEDLIKGERFAFIKGVPKLLGTPHTFTRSGQSGAEISALLPHLAGIADDVAILKSVHTPQFNHAPAQIFMNTGHQIVGRRAGVVDDLRLGSATKSSGLRGVLSGKNIRRRQVLRGSGFFAETSIRASVSLEGRSVFHLEPGGRHTGRAAGRSMLCRN